MGPVVPDDAVTVFGGEPPHNVNDHVSTTASGILTTIARTAVAPGSNVGWILSQSQLLVVLGPEHAATIAGDGLTRADVQRFIYEHARLPLSTLKLGGMWGMHDWPAWMHAVRDERRAHARRVVTRRRLRHRRRGPRQALRRRPQLRLQPRGLPPRPL